MDPDSERLLRNTKHLIQQREGEEAFLGLLLSLRGFYTVVFSTSVFSFFLDNLCVMAIFKLMWGVSFFLSHHLVLADIKDIFFLDISILISGTMY